MYSSVRFLLLPEESPSLTLDDANDGGESAQYEVAEPEDN